DHRVEEAVVEVDHLDVPLGNELRAGVAVVVAVRLKVPGLIVEVRRGKPDLKFARNIESPLVLHAVVVPVQSYVFAERGIAQIVFHRTVYLSSGSEKTEIIIGVVA